MKFQICSDLHLEFPKNNAWLKENLLIPSAEVLIIAGDTYHLDKNYATLNFIKQVSKDFKEVYIIPGNHEYYNGYNFGSTTKPTNKQILTNVHLVNNVSIEIEEIQFIFSIMWSRITLYPMDVLMGMSDFHLIKKNGKRIGIHDYNAAYEACNNFLTAEILKPGPKVVVTHHLPSNECNSDEYKSSPLNEAFCVDKTRFIEHSDITCWVYGHSHRNKADFSINETQLVTNQLGYVRHGEHHSFDREKVVNV